MEKSKWLMRNKLRWYPILPKIPLVSKDKHKVRKLEGRQIGLLALKVTNPSSAC